MPRQLFEKYIECPKCKIGGYDFCPNCLGAGGYSIPTNENPSFYKKPISYSRLKSINDRLSLIVSKNADSKSIDEKLQEYFLELSNSYYDIETVKTLKRILKIKKNITLHRIIKNIAKQTQDVKQIVIDFLGQSENKNEINIYAKFNLPPKKYHIPIKNEYFAYTEKYGIVVKVTKNKWASISSQLLDNLIYNLFNNLLFDLNSFEMSFKPGFEKQIFEKNFRDQLIKLNIYKKEVSYSFLIQSNNLRKIITNYFAELQSREIREWQYIEAQKET